MVIFRLTALYPLWKWRDSLKAIRSLLRMKNNSQFCLLYGFKRKTDTLRTFSMKLNFQLMLFLLFNLKKKKQTNESFLK